MEAAAPQESDFTSGVADTRRILSELGSAATVLELNAHLRALAKQALLVFLHYRGHPPPDSSAAGTIQNILMAAYEDFERYFLSPTSPLATNEPATWAALFNHFRENFFPLFGSAMEALDYYEEALATSDDKSSESELVAERRAATEWKMQCRNQVLIQLELYQAVLAQLAAMGLESFR
jgi:hypothetical protein